jgi:hypothetical protein
MGIDIIYLLAARSVFIQKRLSPFETASFKFEIIFLYVIEI